MSDFWLAEMMARTGVRPGARLGQLISAEEREEWELEQERGRGIETRERKRGVARGRGRWAGGLPGGILGFMLGGPVGAAIGAGLGSYAGQRVATETRISPGAMKTFKRIAPGRYYVGRGEEREREFEWGETERERYMGEQILTSALMDALTAYRAGAYGPGMLGRILGRGAGEILPGYAPEASTYPRLT